MLLALSATAIVVVALLWEVAMPKITAAVDRHRARRARVGGRDGIGHGYDPGRERRAEQRARSLLRSCVNSEEWAMYRDLGFIRVAGRLQAEGPHGLSAGRRRFRGADLGQGGANARPGGCGGSESAYAYLIYPHKPIVAYVPRTGRLLSEY